MKAPSETLKILRGGSYEPQKIFKKNFFCYYKGPQLPPLKFFSASDLFIIFALDSKVLTLERRVYSVILTYSVINAEGLIMTVTPIMT